VWQSGLVDGAILQDAFAGKTYQVEGGSISLDSLGATCIRGET
jgi:hypothetical protein